METTITHAQVHLALAAPLFLAGLVVALALRNRGTSCVGQPIHVNRSGGRRRLLCTAGLALLAVAIWFAPGAPTAMALAVLILAGALVALTPSTDDTAVGSTGVRAGWDAAPFAKLDEWRLTGEHLRWRLAGGEWISSHLPAELHPKVRELLTAENPGRESRFQH